MSFLENITFEIILVFIIILLLLRIAYNVYRFMKKRKEYLKLKDKQ